MDSIRNNIRPVGRNVDLGQFLASAKPGDLLEFDRGSYCHYALYLGNGRVMNIEREEGADRQAGIARIKERSLEDVMGESPVCVKNHDTVAKGHFKVAPRPVPDILSAARSYEDRLVHYEIIFRNCEYYCTLWRFGYGFSTQAVKPKINAFVGKVLKVMYGTLNGNYLLLLCEHVEEFFGYSNAFGGYKMLAALRRLRDVPALKDSG